MSSLAYHDGDSSVVARIYDTEIGSAPLFTGSWGRQRLPTDSIGNMTLTLTNIVIGSRIRIEEQVAGTLVEDRVADTTTEVFTVPVYSGGSASNDLRIKVRQGSTAPYYKDFATLVTAAIGSQSVYIAQIPD